MRYELYQTLDHLSFYTKSLDFFFCACAECISPVSYTHLHVFPPSFSALLLYEYTLFPPVLISLHLSHFRDFPQFMAGSSYNRTEEAQFSTSSLSFHLKMPYNGTMLLLKYIAALLLPAHFHQKKAITLTHPAPCL